ncbi:hypothetical protein OG496_31335 [Streptomyces sp. NBC_00988]|uniref:hypothetical protein n=1 Tax=Streptomyces sp. NBC_00988 TaxID=2903704 RepID=UPI00386CF3A8|nr:hypothetical protein OG496_31335 [Streptomyces sp. NBC_00988]
MATATEPRTTGPVPVEITPRPTTAGPLPVTITSRPIADDEIRITKNIGEFTEGADCSCTASDDQVY